MDEKHKRLFLEWSKTDIYRRRVREAKSIIARYGDRKCYVACSGGKDSLVVLHLVSRVLKDYLVFHWDHGPYLMPRSIELEIWQAMYSIVGDKHKIHILTSHKLFEEKARWDYTVWYRAFYGKLYSWTKTFGLEVGFLGLRGEESITRRRRTRNIVEKKNNILLVYPIWNWSWRDVWAYIVENNIQYPKIYDELAKIYGYDKARLVTFYDKEFEHMGNIEISKFILPQEKEIEKNKK